MVVWRNLRRADRGLGFHGGPAIAIGKPRERSVPPRGTMQEMKKTLLFVAATVLILNATGCGACRNRLLGNRTMAAPMMGTMQQCAPVCQPVCCQPVCDPCCSGGQQMSVGYDGGAMMMMPGMDSGACCGQ